MAESERVVEVLAAVAPIQEPQRFSEELYLFAFATQREVLRYVRTEGLKTERARLPQLMERWSALQPRVRTLVEKEVGVAEGIGVRPIPEQWQALVDQVAQQPLFQKTFQNLPVSFEVVEVDKLVAAQRAVNLTYVQRWQKRYAAPTFAELITICLEPERERQPIQHVQVGSNTHVFSSPVSDVRFLDSAAREVIPEDLLLAESGGLPSNAVVALVGYGCSSINVFKVGQRLILNNGFHRVYALRALGVTDVPVVVQHVHNPSLELPARIADLPSHYLVHEKRPVLLKDFFEPGLAVAVKVPERIRVIKVSVNYSQYDVLV